MKLFRLISCLALLCAMPALSQSAQTFAEEVLQMKDAKQFREMYRSKFHSSFKQQLTETQWVDAATQVSWQTGDNKGRKLVSNEQSGGIHRFRFESTYENAKAYDDVYVGKEGSDWKVAGIWVRPR